MYQVMHTDNGEKNLSEKTKYKYWKLVDKSIGVEKIWKSLIVFEIQRKKRKRHFLPKNAYFWPGVKMHQTRPGGDHYEAACQISWL